MQEEAWAKDSISPEKDGDWREKVQERAAQWLKKAGQG